MVMIFQSEKARNFLLNQGQVFTFRKDRRKCNGRNWITDKYSHPKIADAWIFALGIIIPNKEEMGFFVKKSGFDSLEEWQEEIKRLNNGKLPEYGYLYRVKILDKRTLWYICLDCAEEVPDLGFFSCPYCYNE